MSGRKRSISSVIPIEQWYEKDFWVSHLHPDDREFAVNACLALSKSAVDFEFDYRMVASSGKTVWVHDIVNCGSREGGPGQLRGFLLDINARKQTEAALEQSENQVRLFVEHTPASVAMFDRDMRYILTSLRWLKDYNLGEQNIIGRSHYEVFPEISQRWKEIHQRCLAGAVETCEQDPFPRLDGTLDWVRWEVRPWYSARRDRRHHHVHGSHYRSQARQKRSYANATNGCGLPPKVHG